VKHQIVTSDDLESLAYATGTEVVVNPAAEEASLVHRGVRYVADLNEDGDGAA
jgi:hypothetical protein